VKHSEAVFASLLKCLRLFNDQGCFPETHKGVRLPAGRQGISEAAFASLLK